MRLVEVVVLMGAHCISPVEQAPTQMTTDVGKVQCAVVIEKDTERGTLKVTPQTMIADPRVVAAIARVDAKAGATKIVPAFAPAGSPPTEIKPPPPFTADGGALLPDTGTQQPDAGEVKSASATVAEQPLSGAAEETKVESPAAPVVETKPVARKVVTLAPADQKPGASNAARAQKAGPPKKQQAAATDAPAGQSSQCKGSAVAKWYKTADGHRKYRCVRPVPTSDTPPSQIY